MHTYEAALAIAKNIIAIAIYSMWLKNVVLTSFTAAVFKWFAMLRTNPFLCRVQHFELELVHNKGYDNLQNHQHDNEEAHEVNTSQPTSFHL